MPKVFPDEDQFSTLSIIYGTKTLESLGDELLKLTQEVACGKQTKAESLGYTEMAIARVCNFV